MSKAGALDLALGIGRKIDKNEILSAIDRYEKYHSCYGGDEEERKANYTDMMRIGHEFCLSPFIMESELRFYTRGVLKVDLSHTQVTELPRTLITDLFSSQYTLLSGYIVLSVDFSFYDIKSNSGFYEFGWGESFHFADRWKGESLQESIKRHEHFFALKLGLKPGQKVLDVGCGIGGPLREIARFSSTYVTGLNNNEYQISRGKEVNQIAGVDETCDYVKADFMKMPFPDSTFDAVYAIQATCHAPDAYGCYKEIYRVLKAGQYFAADEWCMTDSFDPNNQEHQKIKADIEIGDGLPDIRSTRKCLEALKQAGFEVIREKDLAAASPVPWYFPLDKSRFSVSSFRSTAVGRFITKNMVKVLEAIGLAPKGSGRAHDFLLKAADGLFEGGKKEIFTPIYFFLARKPHPDSQ